MGVEGELSQPPLVKPQSQRGDAPPSGCSMPGTFQQRPPLPGSPSKRSKKHLLDKPEHHKCQI
jgi:hypothetical protein